MSIPVEKNWPNGEARPAGPAAGWRPRRPKAAKTVPRGRFALRAETRGLHKPAREQIPSDPALCTVIGDQQIDHAAIALHPVGLVVRLEIGIVPAVGGFSDRGFVLLPIGVII